MSDDEVPIPKQVKNFNTGLIGMIMKEKNNNSLVTDDFKNNDDKKFAVDLFKKTINNADEFEQLIESKVKNWELERISKMDLLLIKMALAEVISFNEMPIKVSFNEYIEISK